MGNAAFLDKGSKPLAISAVARKLRLKKSQLLFLRVEMHSLADEEGWIIYEKFREALVKARITKEEEVEVFDLLYTMWDSDGEEKVHYKDFVMGIAPLACPEEAPDSILRFALQLSDERKLDSIDPDELEDLLSSK